MLCCVVLHCVMLCCVVLHCVMLCCVVLNCVMLCCVVLHCVMLFCFISCYVISYYIYRVTFYNIRILNLFISKSKQHITKS